MIVRVLHMADVHLGARLANFGPYAETRRQEQAAAFGRAIDVALAERVHAVLIAGDLFDTYRPELADVNLARRELGRLREAGIQVFAVPGTHDSLSYAACVYRTEPLPLHLFTDPRFGVPATLEIGGVRVAIHGIAYDPERTGAGWDLLARSAPDGIQIALVHAACRFNPEWPIGPEDLPFAPEDLGGLAMDYVALGHYHNVHVFRAGERVLGAYSGSLEGRDWTETGDRHVLVVEWERPDRPPAVRPVAVHSRRVDAREVDVSGLADQEAIAAAVAAACDPTVLWRVVLTGEPEVVPQPETIEAALAPRFLHLQVRDETTLASSHRVAERCEEETVRGEFFRRLVAARERATDERARAVADRALKLGLKVLE